MRMALQGWLAVNAPTTDGTRMSSFLQELFSEESWVQVLLGQGFEMKADPVTNFVPDDDLAGFLEDLADVIDDNAKTLPDHGEFVRRLPPNSEAPQTAAVAPAPANVSFNLRYERGETV